MQPAMETSLDQRLMSVFSGFPSTYVMTSTPAMSTTSAYYIDFTAGATSIGNKIVGQAVLCVRDLPDFPNVALQPD